MGGVILCHSFSIFSKFFMSLSRLFSTKGAVVAARKCSNSLGSYCPTGVRCIKASLCFLGWKEANTT